MGRSIRLAALLGVMLLARGPATAGPAPDVRPSQPAANLSPIVQIFGLPRLTQGLTRPGETRLRLDMDWASHAVSDRAGAAFVRLDGESRRFALTLEGALAPQGAWWALELPYLTHSGGVLDRPIDAWHRALGLPPGDRAGRPRGALRYRVVDRKGREVLRHSRAAAGPGDAALSAGAPLAVPALAAGALTAAVRLEAPTGDPDRLLGNGHWDAAGWLALAGRHGAWSGHLAVGGLYMAGSEVLPGRHRQRAWFGRAALGWRLLAPLMLRAQLDRHGPLYDSPLTPLGSPAWELRLAAAWTPGPDYRVTAGFSEDIAVGTAPDITFHLGVARTWR